MRVTTRKGQPVAVVPAQEAFEAVRARGEGVGLAELQAWFDSELERLGYERHGDIVGRTNNFDQARDIYAPVIRYE